MARRLAEAGVEPPAASTLFAGVPLPSRMRPGPPLDAAADWDAFVRLVRPRLADAPESGRLPADRLSARLAHEPAPLPLVFGTEAPGFVTLRALTLWDTAQEGISATHRFGELDAVTASEILRAPSLLAAAGIS